MAEPITPGQIEIHGRFSQHTGGRIQGAGVQLQFHYNQNPGIHFKTPVDEQYKSAILKGITDGMATRFPNFPETGSIWITGVDEHLVDSSRMAFYMAARMVVEQAYFLRHINYDTSLLK